MEKHHVGLTERNVQCTNNTALIQEDISDILQGILKNSKRKIYYLPACTSKFVQN